MKQTVLVGLHIEIEPDYSIGRYCRTIEQREKEYESWCREFEAFIRDHRSRDGASLSVVRETQEQCSHCGYEWETDDTGCPVCCQQAIDEFEQAAISKAEGLTR